MKKWIVTHVNECDKVKLKTTEIEGISYTDAYVNFMVKYPLVTFNNTEYKFNTLRIALIFIKIFSED